MHRGTEQPRDGYETNRCLSVPMFFSSMLISDEIRPVIGSEITIQTDKALAYTG